MANDDLIAPLASETFTSFAHTAAASYAASGAVTNQSHGQQPLTISYNSASNSYTISVAGRSQTFGPANQIGAGAYRRVEGSVTDDLTLPVPGSTASPFRYVGTGAWQRQRQTASGIDGSFDIFVYGIPTASLVRTGSAYYSINVLGAINSGEAQPNTFRGTGQLSANLGTGRITAGADFLVYRPDGTRVSNSSRDGALSAEATLAASGSTFSGTVVVPSFAEYRGTLTGGFFGPLAEEVGASYSAQATNGNVLAGSLMGARNAALAVPGLAELTERTTFIGASAFTAHSDVLTYDPAAGTYAITATVAEPTGALTVGPAQRAAVQSDSRFIQYNVTQNGRDARVLFYRIGADNSELQLTYATFARLSIAPTGSTTTPAPFLRDFVYGMRTPFSALPRFGTANYAGVIYGSANDEVRNFSVSGTSALRVDFAGYNVSGELRPVLTNLANGATLDYGVQSLGVVLFDNRSIFSGGIGSDGGQSITGYFFGPQAEELGAAFRLRRFDATTPNGPLNVYGITVAKRQ